MTSSTKIPASVCMLCFNEADRLHRTLGMLHDFAEIIILDSGSTDGSQAICREFGAQVVEHAWEGFAPMRRRVFSMATQPWIFWLDADEVVRPELLNSIRQAVASNTSTHTGYFVNRIVNFENRWISHGNWFPDWTCRLFRAGAWAMPDRLVHEALEINGTTGRLKGLLEHYSYRDWEDLRTRARRYAELSARQANEQGKRVGAMEAFFRASWRTFRGFILRLGFLNGILGWKIALANGQEVWQKYKILREINSQKMEP